MLDVDARNVNCLILSINQPKLFIIIDLQILGYYYCYYYYYDYILIWYRQKNDFVTIL